MELLSGKGEILYKLNEIEESLINSVMQQLTFHCTPEVHVRFDPENGQKFDICNANRQFELEIMPKLISQ